MDEPVSEYWRDGANDWVSVLIDVWDGESMESVSGFAAGWKRLEMPVTTIPGCRPKNGESRDRVPRIRCLNGCWR